MVSSFSVILEEFEQELAAIEVLVEASADQSGGPRARVAGANAAILLLAATFEEFVRDLARTYARAVVETCESYEKLPQRLPSIAWKRTMQNLAKVRLNPKKEVFSRESIFADAITQFNVVYEFCRGDLSQDIYKELIHNENNMRPQEINALFNISGLNNVCSLACGDVQLRDLFREVDGDRGHDLFVERLEEFVERRNQVAHSIAAMRSSGPQLISEDIELLRRFGRALCMILETKASSLPARRSE